MVQIKFKGLMAPVFTPFNNDKTQSINYELIDKYASYLKQKGIPGVLVNGTSGEGMSLSVAERKKVTELWWDACKKYEIEMMVQVGGCPLPDVIELTKHAEELKVGSILCLPELYFKPRTEEKLVEYIEAISEYCPNTPLLYYHIPMLTQLELNMPRFIDLAGKKVPNFAGIKYTSNNLEAGAGCLKYGQSIFLGSDTTLCGALALGFDSSIMTTLNICPELSIDIYKHMENGNVDKAREVQRILSSRVEFILQYGDWVTAMKRAFNELNIGLDMGPVRKPL